MAPDEPGRILGHFEIHEPLGSGGMGEVFRARDLDLGREVAIKFVSGERRDDPSYRRRLLTEARAAAALNHPGICTIHEVGIVQAGETAVLPSGASVPSGTPYVAMELVPGESLDDLLLREGPLEPDRARNFARQVAGALAAAHALGFVHRDLKPANLMITPDDRVKILDFGLAKRTTVEAGESLGATATVTEPGTILGTVPYMSPEQAAGRAVDFRSDQFSLGVVLYEMLTGRRPFDAGTPTETLSRILQSEPDPFTLPGSGSSAGLTDTLERCLRKDPGERFPDTADLVRALGEGKGRRVAGRRWPFVAAIAALAVLVLWQVRDRDPGPGTSGRGESIAVLGFRALESGDDDPASAGLTELVAIGLTENSPVRVVSPELLRDLRRRAGGAADGTGDEEQALEMAREAGVSHFLAGLTGTEAGRRFATWRVVRVEDGESIRAGRLEESTLTGLADGIVEAALVSFAPDPDASVVSVTGLTTSDPEAFKHYMGGVLAREAGELARAERELAEAVARDSTFALAWFERGRVEYGSGWSRDLDRMRDFYERAWVHRDRLSEKERLRLEAYRYAGDARFDQAMDTFEEILARWPDDRETLRDVAGRYFSHWMPREAIAWMENGLRLYPDDPVLGGDLYISALAGIGRDEEAIRLCRASLGADPDQATLWETLGALWLGVGEVDSAEAAYRRFEVLAPQEFALAPWRVDCAFARGDLDEAFGELFRNQEENGMIRMSQVVPLLLAAGRYAEADSILRVGARNMYGFGGAFWALRMGQPDSAVALMEPRLKWVNDRRGKIYAWSILGIGHARLGNLAAARAAVDTLYAIDRRPGGWAEWVARWVEAEIALAAGEPREAIRFVGLAEDQLHHTGYYWRLWLLDVLARAQTDAGLRKEAVATYGTILRRYGGWGPAYHRRAILHEELGRPDEARRDLDRFLELWAKADPDRPELADARRRRARL